MNSCTLWQPRWLVVHSRAIRLSSLRRPRTVTLYRKLTVPAGKERHEYFAAVVRTLDPDRLETSDVLDLTGTRINLFDRHYFVPRPVPTKGGSRWQRRLVVSDDDLKNAHVHSSLIYQIGARAEGDIKPQSRRRFLIPFPPDTRGWLYYHRPPHYPDITGQVRFRLISRKEPLDFWSGTDLSLPTGLPWAIRLFDIASLRVYTVIRNVLLRDGLVDSTLLQSCATIAIGAKANVLRNRFQYLLTLRDPFVLDLAQNRCFWVWAEGGLHRWEWSHTRYPYEASSFWRPVDSGKILCHFERSTLKDHAGRRMLLLRVLKIIEPVQPSSPHYHGRISQPSEGALLCRDGHPVALDADAVKAVDGSHPLRALYDSDPGAS